MLHAASLTFPHPLGGERKVLAPLPSDFTAMLNALGLPPPEQPGSTPVDQV
jgi:tRNA pseudouridine32 synthase/23S rRNA pseudouridine746 synthase